MISNIERFLTILCDRPHDSIMANGVDTFVNIELNPIAHGRNSNFYIIHNNTVICEMTLLKASLYI